MLEEGEDSDVRYADVRGASKIKVKNVNKKRMAMYYRIRGKNITYV
jgi:hypothetical protein